MFGRSCACILGLLVHLGLLLSPWEVFACVIPCACMLGLIVHLGLLQSLPDEKTQFLGLFLQRILKKNMFFWQKKGTGL